MVPGMKPPRCFPRARNIYDEYRPLLSLLQLFGVAPFVVGRNRNPEPSKVYAVFFAIQSSCLIYCLYDTKISDSINRMSKYTLTVLVYDVVSITGSACTVLSLIRCLAKADLCGRLWANMRDISEDASKFGCPPYRSKWWCLLKTFIFLLGFAAFVFLTFNLQTNKSKLRIQFWVVWYLPLFHNCLIGMACNTYCCHLRRKFAASNGSLTRDIASLRNGHQRVASWVKIRTFRENHFRGYEITKDLNTLFGPHFLYIFVSYFIGGTLDFCNIIRLYDATSPSSVVRYRSALYWTVVQSALIVNIVFSGTLLRREVQRMMLLVHEYLVLIDDRDSNLRLELGVAILSNSLFFVQIDKLKKMS